MNGSTVPEATIENRIKECQLDLFADRSLGGDDAGQQLRLVCFAGLCPGRQPASQGVESRRGAVAWALWASLRFLSPLIKPDVRISRIRLPDRLHLKAHGGGPRWTRRSRITPSSPNTTLSGKRLVPRDDTLWRLTRK